MTERVWAAHGLEPQHRCVLLAVARQVQEGATEALVNRTALAQQLQTSPGVVSRGIGAGERAGLIAIRPNGHIAFVPAGLPMGEAPAPSRPAVRPIDGVPAASPGTVTGQWVKGEFARQWEERYRQRYVFTPGKDDKLALGIARTLTAAEVTGRVRAYLNHPDGYYARCAHAFGLFVARINEFAVVPAASRGAVRPEDDPEYGSIVRKQRRMEAAR
jgi:hypothetical protein